MKENPSKEQFKLEDVLKFLLNEGVSIEFNAESLSGERWVGIELGKVHTLLKIDEFFEAPGDALMKLMVISGVK